MRHLQYSPHLFFFSRTENTPVAFALLRSSQEKGREPCRSPPPPIGLDSSFFRTQSRCPPSLRGEPPTKQKLRGTGASGSLGGGPVLTTSHEKTATFPSVHAASSLIIVRPVPKYPPSPSFLPLSLTTLLSNTGWVSPRPDDLNQPTAPGRRAPPQQRKLVGNNRDR